MEVWYYCRFNSLLHQAMFKWRWLSLCLRSVCSSVMGYVQFLCSGSLRAPTIDFFNCEESCWKLYLRVSLLCGKSVTDLNPAHLLSPTLSFLKAAILVADKIPMTYKEDSTLRFNVSCLWVIKNSK